MKRLRKVLLIIAILLLVSQVPFIYRRYRLGRLNAQIQMLNANRQPISSNSNYAEYKGVLHVHSFLGGHSRGSFGEIIAAARTNQLDFVVMTEHPEADIDTAELTLKGIHGGVLFVNGNEVSTSSGERLLILPGDTSARNTDKVSVSEVVNAAKMRGAVSLAAYPAEFKSWDTVGLDGIEIFNVYSNAQQINRFLAVFDVLWSQRSYPDLLFASFYAKPSENLKKWDEALSKTRLSAVAGNDSHANIGISLQDSGGKTLLGLHLDPYETSFRLVRMHVLIPHDETLTADSLLRAIRLGHCFIAFDLLTDTTGFSFTAQNSGDWKIQGDEIPLQQGTLLQVAVPVRARVAVLKDGQVWNEALDVSAASFEVTERGIYRVEAYLPQLGKPFGGKPWIISNPIFVK